LEAGEAFSEGAGLGLGVILLLFEVLVLFEAGGKGDREALIHNLADDLSVGGLQEKWGLGVSRRGAEIWNRCGGKCTRVDRVAFTISGRDFGVGGLDGVGDIGGDEEVANGGGGVRDDNLMVVRGKGVVYHPSTPWVVPAILPRWQMRFRAFGGGSVVIGPGLVVVVVIAFWILILLRLSVGVGLVGLAVDAVESIEEEVLALSHMRLTSGRGGVYGCRW
jgi:hypothetical protein